MVKHVMWPHMEKSNCCPDLNSIVETKIQGYAIWRKNSNSKYFDFWTNWISSCPLIVTVTKIFAISKNLSESKVVIIKVIWECEMSIITILASLRILRMFQLIQWNNQENKIPVLLRLHFKLSKAPTFEKLLNILV